MIYEKIPEEKYKYIMENMPFCCVDLIVCFNKKVLLIKRKEHPAKNEFWFPGGRIYKNEKVSDAVKRKAFEEIGANVKIERKIGCYETFFKESIFNDLKTGTHTISIVYLTSLLNSDISLDETSSEFRWIDKIENTLHSHVRKVLKDSKIFD